MLSAAILLIATCLGFPMQNAVAQQNEQRVALVIGNSAYKDAPLRNPANDATDVAAVLKGLGFNVRLLTNVNRRQIVEAVREFGGRIRRGGVGFFYYAGHGVQSRCRNFLIPIGAQVEGEMDLEFEALDANRVLAQMDEAGNRVNIVVLDACRDNPFARSFRSASRGLAQLDAARGSFLAYATAPGSVAADGTGRNGIYTKHLLESLKQPDTRLENVFKRVRLQVAKETGNKQIPWDASSVLGDFYFRPPSSDAQVANTVVAVSTPIDSSANDRAFWDSVKESRNPDEPKAYLEQFPGGTFVPLARARLNSLQVAQAPTTQFAAAAPSVQSRGLTMLSDNLQGLSAGTVFRDCADCPEVVVIPPCNYMMGGSRAISIPRAFAVGKFEVTFAQWDACFVASGCTHRPDDNGWGRGSRPVMNVSWDDAKQYAAWISQRSRKSYRLLTDAEWEYAARVGTTTLYYRGDSDTNMCQYASVYAYRGGCGTGKTPPVGERRPNAFGLHDTLGNVWEWTEDCWNEGVGGVPMEGSARPAGECGQRVLRGGSWYDYTIYARSAHRTGEIAGYCSGLFGFRVARTD